MKHIKLAVLECFNLINQEQKESVLDEIDINKQVATNIISTLQRSDAIRQDQLNSDQKNQVGEVILRAIIEDRRIEQQANNIDPDNPVDQLDGFRINHEDLSNKSDTIGRLHDIGGRLDRPLGPCSKSIYTWLQAKNLVVLRNARLTDDLVNKTKVQIEIEKEKRSLLDDYANPSLEQPSYMDPED